MALWSWRFWCSKQGKPRPLGTPHAWRQTLRIISRKRWPPSSVSGGHTVTFSYPLTAEIVPLFVPSPPTVYHTILHEKAIYKQWRLTICTGFIKHIFKEKDINWFFSLQLYTRGGVVKWLSTPESLCKFTHRKNCFQVLALRSQTHTHPLHFPIRYMQKKTGARGSAFIQRRPRAPFTKGKSYLMIWIHKLFSTQYITLSR